MTQTEVLIGQVSLSNFKQPLSHIYRRYLNNKQESHFRF